LCNANEEQQKTGERKREWGQSVEITRVGRGGQERDKIQEGVVEGVRGSWGWGETVGRHVFYSSRTKSEGEAWEVKHRVGVTPVKAGWKMQ